MGQDAIRDVVIRLAIDISNAQKNIDSLTASTDKLTQSLSAAQSASTISAGSVGGVRATAAGSSSVSTGTAPSAATSASAKDEDKARQHRLDLDKQADKQRLEAHKSYLKQRADSDNAAASEAERRDKASSQHTAKIDTAKGALQLLSSATGSDQMMHMVVMAEGVANIAKNAGLAEITLTPLTVGLGVFAAAAVATAVAVKMASDQVERMQIGLRKSASMSLIAHDIASQSSLRHFAQDSALATMRPYTGHLRAGLQSFAAERQREAQIRQFEAGSASPEMKARFRQRMETQGGLEAEQRETQEQLKYHRERLAQSQTARKTLETDQPKVWREANKVLAAADEKVKQATAESTPGFLYRQAQKPGRAIAGALGFNTGVGKSGFTITQENAQRQAEIEQGNAKNQLLNAESGFRDKITESTRQEEESKQKIAELELKSLTTTRAQQQAAYQAAQSERIRVQGLNSAFGSADVGARQIAIDIQNHAKENEAIRAANIAAGRDADEGITRLNQFELEQPVFGSAAASREQRLEYDRIAKEEGLEVETDLPELEARLKAEMGKKLDTKRAEAAAGDADKAADAIGEAFKQNFPLKEIIDAINKRGAELRVEIESAAQLNNLHVAPGA